MLLRSPPETVQEYHFPAAALWFFPHHFSSLGTFSSHINQQEQTSLPLVSWKLGEFSAVAQWSCGVRRERESCVGSVASLSSGEHTAHGFGWKPPPGHSSRQGTLRRCHWSLRWLLCKKMTTLEVKEDNFRGLKCMGGNPTTRKASRCHKENQGMSRTPRSAFSWQCPHSVRDIFLSLIGGFLV